MIEIKSISPKPIQPQCICCTESAEWAEKWCQEHWEAECGRAWWEMIDRLYPLAPGATENLPD
jgi:hypothetical protein